MLNTSRFILLLCTTASLVSADADTNVVSQPEEVQRVNVTVYYESLCPDSMNFIKNELYPVYLSLSDFFSTQWVPYGKATHRRAQDGSYSFRCQHGSQECLGNKIQACALDVLSDEDAMKWINCVMSTRAPQSAGARCSRSLGVDYEPIRECSSSSRGDQLLAHYGDLTHALRPRLAFVPTVIFNGVYDAERQDQALMDFRGVICSYIPADQRTGRCN